MSTAPPRRGPSLPALLLLALLLFALGGAAAIWALTRWDSAARFIGLEARSAASMARPAAAVVPASPSAGEGAKEAADLPPGALARVSELEARLARVESAATRTEGSVGRADALLIAFAARRAIDRGVALGYLEPLLADRFGQSHRQAVATIITASRRPVRLDQLIADLDALEPVLKSVAPGESFLSAARRQLGSLITIRHADRPSPRPSPTFDRAKARLAAGQVDQALAEVMRLPGVGRAEKWVGDARTYIAAHRALDEIETAALLVP